MIASTNRIANIDSAALRRFISVIRFSSLMKKQLVSMYTRVLAPFGHGPISPNEMNRLYQLNGVTTADMVRIRSRLYLENVESIRHEILIAMLASTQSSNIPHGPDSTIGF